VSGKSFVPRNLDDAEIARLAKLPIWEKVPAGDWYKFAAEPELQAAVEQSSRGLKLINQTAETDSALARTMLQEFAPGIDPSARIIFPIATIEYPQYLKVGADSFINSGLQVVSGGRVTIGANCFIGPNCQLFTPNHHSSDKMLRRAGWQYDAPITIGDDCWFGGSVIVLPGVTIGDNVVVGAGAVVTKDVPANCTVGGNPARIIKRN